SFWSGSFLIDKPPATSLEQLTHLLCLAWGTSIIECYPSDPDFLTYETRNPRRPTWEYTLPLKIENICRYRMGHHFRVKLVGQDDDVFESLRKERCLRVAVVPDPRFSKEIEAAPMHDSRLPFSLDRSRRKSSPRKHVRTPPRVDDTP